MKVAVTGAKGFVGTNLCEALDDVKPIEVGDMLDFSGCDAVIHLAANADVRNGWDEPDRDLYHNTLFTHQVLEQMRSQGVKRLLFASSSSVYGNAPTPTPESYAGQQTSLYGASKLACEGLIGAYAEAGFISATVLRLTSMLGPRYRHGLVADFVAKLKESRYLEVLGGGLVQRTRMDVTDGVAAFLERLPETPRYEVFNVGTDETINSYDVAKLVAEAMGIDAEITAVGESWVGDHPIWLDASKLRATGWEPRYTIREGIARTVAWLLK